MTLPPRVSTSSASPDRGRINVDRAENLAKTGARVHDEIFVRGGFDLRAFAGIVLSSISPDIFFHDVLDRC